MGAIQTKQFPPYTFQYTFNLTKNLIIPKPDHSIALPFQPCGSLFIFHMPIGMLPTIHLDNQHFVETDKINDISPDRALTSKFATFDLLESQPTPQCTFAVGHVFSQTFGVMYPIHFPRYFAFLIAPIPAFPRRGKELGRCY